MPFPPIRFSAWLPRVAGPCLFLLLSQPVHAFPQGGKSGLLGNTASRPDDIGSAQVYPSAITTLVGDTKLFSGLMYYQASLNGQKDELKSKLVPFFTGTQYQVGELQVATYFTYEDSFSGRTKLSLLNGAFRADLSGTDENLVLGVPVAIRLSPEWSLGAAAIVSAFTSETRLVASNVNPPNSFLLSTDSTQTLYLLGWTLSASHEAGPNFWSLALRTAHWKLAGSGHEVVNLFRQGADPNEVAQDYEPRQSFPWVASIGWSLASGMLRPAFDLQYFFPRSSVVTDGASASDSRQLTFEPTFALSAGLAVELGSVSWLTGVRFKRKTFERSGYDEPMILNLSLGLQLNTWQSHPTVGVFFEQAKGRSSVELYGLSYTTRYDL